MHFVDILTEYEKIEMQSYKQVYFVGSASCAKIQGSASKSNNYGFDDDRGDYNVVMFDHLCYRFEVIDKLGAGSFGQAVKCFDHKTK